MAQPIGKNGSGEAHVKSALIMNSVDDARLIDQGIPSGCGGYDTVVVGVGASVVVVALGAGTVVVTRPAVVGGAKDTGTVTVVEDAGTTVVEAGAVEVVDSDTEEVVATEDELVVEVPSEELEDEHAPRSRAVESSRVVARYLCRIHV